MNLHPLFRPFYFLLILCFNSVLDAQTTGPEQDCINAIPVCQTQYIQNTSYQGRGPTQEVNDDNSCLNNGENNSVWYIFNISIAGRLEFSIIPQAADDYDFALYNLTGHSCEDIFNGGLEVSCSYTFSNGAIGDGLSVTTGETYALLIDNFSSSTSGYTIDFNPNNASTASIIDFIPPAISLISPPDCENPTMITVSFTEPILCNTIDSSGNQFNISGPSSLSVVHARCAGTSSASVELTLSGPVDVAGNYQFAFNPGNDVEDLCGNTANNDTTSFFAPVGILTDFTYTCNEKDLSFTNTSVSADTFTSVWTFSDGDTSTDFNPTHFFNLQGTFTVTLTNENAQCISAKTEVITVKDTFFADFSYINSGSQVIDFSDESTPGATDFLWSTGNGFNYIVQNPSIYFPDPGNYTVCLTASLGCYSDSACQLVTVDSVTSIKQLSGNEISIQIFPNPVNGITRINLLNYPAAKGEAMLYNTLGEQISVQLFNSKSFEMDFNTLPSGIYLLKIESGNMLAAKKVMKL